MDRKETTFTPESCEDCFSVVSDNIGDIFYVLDTNGRFVFVNRAIN